MNQPLVFPETRDKDRLSVLAKGLRVIESFDAAHTRMTASQAGRRTDMTPAAARRCLLTLQQLGYVQSDGKWFWLSHGCLRVVYAYNASTQLPRLLQPALDQLSERTKESATLSVLDGDQVVVAARANARQTLRVSLSVGSHLPLFCSAAGRVLLAAMPEPQWTSLVERRHMTAFTPHTVTHMAGLRRLLLRCQDEGYAMCDEEIELGVRSIAIPVHNAQGEVVAAMSVSTRTERMLMKDMVRQCLPLMRQSRQEAERKLS
jgi:IclR family pca regulon transcriptional regulator